MFFVDQESLRNLVPKCPAFWEGKYLGVFREIWVKVGIVFPWKSLATHFFCSLVYKPPFFKQGCIIIQNEPSPVDGSEILHQLTCMKLVIYGINIYHINWLAGFFPSTKRIPFGQKHPGSPTKKKLKWDPEISWGTNLQLVYNIQGGGFKYVLCSTLFGEDSHFD